MEDMTQHEKAPPSPRFISGAERAMAGLRRADPPPDVPSPMSFGAHKDQHNLNAMMADDI
jgi:hypothetical protein